MGHPPHHTFQFLPSPLLTTFDSTCLLVARASVCRRVIPSKEKNSSSLVALSATPLPRVPPTRPDPTCMVCSDASLVPLKVTTTLRPTRSRVSSGTNEPCLNTSKTRKSTSRAPRWPFRAGRSPRTEPIAWLTCASSRTKPHLLFPVFILIH